MNYKFREEENSPRLIPLPSLVPSANETEAITNSSDATSLEEAELSDPLALENSRHKRQTRIAILSHFLLFGGLSGLILFGQRIFGDALWTKLMTTSGFILVYIGFCALYVGLFLPSAFRLQRRRRKIAKSLVEQPVTESLGSLVNMLALEDGMTRRTVALALIALLPRIEEADFLRLTPNQHFRLRNVFQFSLENPLGKDVLALFKPADKTQTEFRTVLLDTFAHFGDESHLPVLERLAQSDAKTEGEEVLLRTARAGLPMLRDRISRRSAEKTLLRASSVEETGATLLRPSTENPAHDADELLRPHDP